MNFIPHIKKHKLILAYLPTDGRKVLWLDFNTLKSKRYDVKAYEGTDSTDKSLLSSDSMHKVDPSEV